MAKYKIIPSSRTIVRSPISIGHKAEKGVEAIEFDVTAWVETYGSGTLTVIMRRWGDAIPYPIALEIGEDNKATWTLSDIDTAKAGMAYAQLNYIVGDEVVKKSDIYAFRVMDSLTGEGEPPEAYDSWLEHLTHLAAEAMAEVLDIEGIVTDKTLTVDGGIADAKATGDALALKADKSTTYTKTEVDQMIEDVEVETDTTLSVSGAAADAKKTGDELSALKADLGALGSDIPGVQEKSFYTTRASSSGTTHGIAYVFNHTTYTVTESGTATSNAYVNIIGSNSVIPSALSKGRKYKLVWNSTDENILLQIAVKDSGGNTLSGGISGVSPIEFEIPQNAYGLIVRTVVYSGATVDGVISDFHFEGAVSENLKPSGDTSDRTTEILKILNKIGSCRLESGVYYVSGLVMPEGTDLKGAGKSTVLRLIDSNESEEVCAIKMGRHCTVSDLSIIGADSDITLPEAEGKRVGILFSADDNTDVTTTTVRGNVKGVYISRMTGSGIKCYNTGYSSSGNANWSNLWVWNCFKGINIDYFSEYHHFSCFNVSSCKYGVVCNGGNNIFSCGSLTANENGFRLDNSAGDKPNNGHGSCVGLNINHNNGTSGQAVYINDCGSGFLFLGCHISQGEIALTKVGGVIFSACHFGSSARVTITNGWGILFNGCTSSGSLASPNPTVSITNNTATRFLDCFYKGGALWAVCAPSAESLDARITALENA